MGEEERPVIDNDSSHIPLPRNHLVLKRCPYPNCNTGWFSMAGYRGHYALRHVLNQPDRPE